MVLPAKSPSITPVKADAPKNINANLTMTGSVTPKSPTNSNVTPPPGTVRPA